MTIDVVRHGANGMSRVFCESIWGPADEIDTNNASPMPRQLSHRFTSRTTCYVLRTTTDVRGGNPLKSEEQR
jgi:hypothetical protein